MGDYINTYTHTERQAYSQGGVEREGKREIDWYQEKRPEIKLPNQTKTEI